MARNDQYKEPTVRKTIEFSADDMAWYDANYPGNSFWWLMNNLFSAFRNAHEVTPQHYIILAAQRVKAEIDSPSGS